MAEHDPLEQLADLARAAEQQADPWPAARVRQLGTQRRHRRHALSVAAVAAVVALGGGFAFTQLGAGTNLEPNPVATPTAAAPSTSPAPSTGPTPSTTAPVRTVTETNLLTTADIPLQVESNRVVVTAAGVGRPAAATSVCVPDSIELLGATSTRDRNFRTEVTDPTYNPDPSDPLSEQPTVYSQGLQFADAELAEQARTTYQGWVADCLDQLRASQDREVIGTGWKLDWHSVRSGSRVVGSFAEVPIYRDRSDSSENGYFETVGLTRVDDRLMITVDLMYGNEKHYSLDQGGDPTTEMPADPQFALVVAAAKRLRG